MISIHHETHYQYSKAPVQSVQRLHLTPSSSDAQQIKHWQIDLEGTDMVFSCRDHHGNIVHIAAQNTQNPDIKITASGKVETKDVLGVAGRHDNFLPLDLYRQETDYCKPGPALRKLEAKMPKSDEDISFLHDLSAYVTDQVTYQKAKTNSQTDAEFAAAQGSGVCQDHVHIFLTLARRKGFAARYVSGHLVTPTELAHQATHAWAEVHVKGLGWVGFDISNGISPDQNYIKLASGFDYRDVQPVAGMRFGDGTEVMTTEVSSQ